MTCCFAAVSVAKQYTLVIDAGHGGHDAGAVGAFSKEKDINLRTALALGKHVQANCPDVKVIYTRKTDTFVTLLGRADIANKAKADLFISIHTNALPKNKTARGLETYTLGMHRAGDNLDVAKRENSVILVEKDYKERYQGFDPNSAESYIIFEFMQDHNMQRSVDMAKLVQTNVCQTAARQNKGVKQAGFLVLRETSMPSCLIELGFISTPAEEQQLNNDAVIDNIARGICTAFMKYRGKYEGSYNEPTGSRAVVEEPVQAKPLPEHQPKPVVDVMPREVKEQKMRVTPETPEDSDEPMFKVQVFVADRVLKSNDARFKGETGAEHYRENGMVKYTIGASNDYNEIYRLCKQLAPKFQGCFIVAFKKGEKMNVNEAIREFKQKRR